MNLVDLNKISQVHNGKDIIFCKTDFIKSEFEKIKDLKNNIIFVTGNSDYVIDDNIVNSAPSNIKKWFCQNRISRNPLLEAIPIGVQNSTWCKRHNDNSYDFSHGYVFDYAPQKIKTLLNKNKNNFELKNLIYANFSIGTNVRHRSSVKQLIANNKFITWEEPSENYENFLQMILDHEAVICPNGNGPDTHRLYETAFLERVAITFDPLQYEFIHRFFPVVLITGEPWFNDIDSLKFKIKQAKENFDKKYLDADFWCEKIIQSSKEIN